MPGGLREVVLSFRFRQNRLNGFRYLGGRNLPFPILKASGLYNSLYYRTSRDKARLSRVIPWTSSAITCRSSLPLHLQLSARYPSSREFADYQAEAEGANRIGLENRFDFAITTEESVELAANPDALGRIIIKPMCIMYVTDSAVPNRFIWFACAVGVLSVFLSFDASPPSPLQPPLGLI